MARLRAKTVFFTAGRQFPSAVISSAKVRNSTRRPGPSAFRFDSFSLKTKPISKLKTLCRRDWIPQQASFSTNQTPFKHELCQFCPPHRPTCQRRGFRPRQRRVRKQKQLRPARPWSYPRFLAQYKHTQLDNYRLHQHHDKRLIQSPPPLQRRRA